MPTYRDDWWRNDTTTHKRRHTDDDMPNYDDDYGSFNADDIDDGDETSSSPTNNLDNDDSPDNKNPRRNKKRDSDDDDNDDIEKDNDDDTDDYDDSSDEDVTDYNDSEDDSPYDDNYPTDEDDSPYTDDDAPNNDADESPPTDDASGNDNDTSDNDNSPEDNLDQSPNSAFDSPDTSDNGVENTPIGPDISAAGNQNADSAMPDAETADGLNNGQDIDADIDGENTSDGGADGEGSEFLDGADFDEAGTFDESLEADGLEAESLQEGNIGGQEFVDAEPDVTSDQSGMIDGISGGDVDDVRNMKAGDAAKMAGDSSGTIEGKVAGRVASAVIPDDMTVEDAAKTISKRGVWGLGLAIALPALGTLLAVVVGVIVASTFLRAIQDEESSLSSVAGACDVSGSVIDANTTGLTPEVLRWESDVRKEAKTQGIDDGWVPIILGVIQQETGGLSERYPDIMQSSESQGWPMNTITDPKESIHYGVMAFKDAVDTADKKGVTDVRAILQGYNMGSNFINWLISQGKNYWTSDLAEKYSMEVVYPAVTGGGKATAANRAPNNAPWAVAIGKPYYIYNGGDFHYPNAIMTHIGTDYMSDGPIYINTLGASSGVSGDSSDTVADGCSSNINPNFGGSKLPGYAFPIPDGEFQITSNYGWRDIGLHKGIDLQYKGDKYHGNGPVYAIADGQVVAAGWSESMGNYVRIRHKAPGKNSLGVDGNTPIESIYMHFSSTPTVKAGMTVKRGQQIGNEGNTGFSFGNHLHLQLEQNNVHFDPRKVFDFPQPVL